MIYVKDKLTIDKKTKNVVIARDGIYQYLGVEIGIPEDTNVYNVLRTTDSCKTVVDEINKMGCIPVTIEHPKSFVDLSEDKIFKRGGVGQAMLKVKDGFTVAVGKMVGLTEDVIDLIEKGSEVSLGSTAEIKPIVDNKDYSYIMEIREVNHVAIVANGRCGKTCVIEDAGGFKNKVLRELKMDLDKLQKDNDAMKAELDVCKTKISDMEAKKAEMDVKAKEMSDAKTKEVVDAELVKANEAKATEIKDATQAGFEKGQDSALAKTQEAMAFIDAGHLTGKDFLGKKPCEVIDAKLKDLFSLSEIVSGERAGYVALALKKEIKDGWTGWGAKKEKTKSNKSFLERIKNV